MTDSENLFSYSIVVPAFNECESIADVIKSVKSYFPKANVIIVDDGSTDGTGDIARRAGAEVISHPTNKGNGSCIKSVLRYSTSDKIIVIDADNQHPASEISVILERLRNFDLVIGARESKTHANIVRRFGNSWLASIASFLSDHKIPDLTSGFRGFDRIKALEFIHLYPNRFSFPTTSTLAFIQSGYDVTFFPIKASKRPVGTKSKIKVLNDGMKFLILIIRVSAMINPLRIFMPGGLLLLLLGTLWTIRNVILFSRFSEAGVIGILGGLNILFLGILADQLSYLRLQRR